MKHIYQSKQVRYSNNYVEVSHYHVGHGRQNNYQFTEITSNKGEQYLRGFNFSIGGNYRYTHNL